MTIRATSLVRGWRNSIHSIPHIAARRVARRPRSRRRGGCAITATTGLPQGDDKRAEAKDRAGRRRRWRQTCERGHHARGDRRDHLFRPSAWLPALAASCSR